MSKQNFEVLKPKINFKRRKNRILNQDDVILLLVFAKARIFVHFNSTIEFMAIEVGQTAPDFTLFSDEKKAVTLSDYRGKNVVINFFPAAYTGPCTAQLCDARDNMKKYESLNAEVLGVSVDSPFTLAKFKADNEYNFPLLSDFNKVVIDQYGIYLDTFVLGMSGVSKRAIFVIDTEGVVRYAEVTPSAGDTPNFAAVREALEAI